MTDCPASSGATTRQVSRADAEALLTRLVEIPSLSGRELAASRFLVESMRSLGYERCEVDAAGNAVGEIGPVDAARTVVLLGHIDTVYGEIPVRVEERDDGSVLHGRGTVDAKGPLVTFASAAARLGTEWARNSNIRIVVVGAVEEEAATSKGARFIRDRFDGACEPAPDYCVIGEPSGVARITLGYKGRLLLEMQAAQPMAHSAGPHPGVATLAVDLWNMVRDRAEKFNRDRPKTFDQLLPSLRDINTQTDEAMLDRVRIKIGLRLPLDFEVDAFLEEVWHWAQARTGGRSQLPRRPYVEGKDGGLQRFHFGHGDSQLEFIVHGQEPAWRGDRRNALVRSFLAAIRELTPDRPRFVSKSGTSDMNVVGPAWQCPIAAYGPGDSSLDHAPNEHISLDEFWQAVLVLETALRRLGLQPA
ncbi:MAG: M20/M25/M40 family metallo-hydrolase [Caldilineaceae bacterium]|nr:M20/M25/M40 family metallo-hydrolase [Caldilineaceae bacterium]